MITRLRRAVAGAGSPTAFAADVFHPLAEAYMATREPASSGLPGAAVASLERLAILERFCDDEWVPLAMLGLARLRDDAPGLVGLLSELDRFAHVVAALKPAHSDRRNAYRRLAEAWRGTPGLPPGDLFELDRTHALTALRRMVAKPKTATNGFTKTLLVRLDLEISGRSLAHYEELCRRIQLSEEHVLPCGPTLPTKSDWRRDFPNGDTRRILAETIANLVLLDGHLNSKAEQHDFKIKQHIYESAATAQGLVLMQELLAIDDWSPDALAARQRRLVEIVVRIWRLPAEPSDFELPASPQSRAGRAAPARQPATATSAARGAASGAETTAPPAAPAKKRRHRHQKAGKRRPPAKKK
jgi:hypothetical protein